MTARKRNRIVHRGRKLTLILSTVDTPEGPVELEIVQHPGAAVILPLLPDGLVVLIRNRRIAVHEELWELPAGTRQPPESPEECARRELAEETGFQAGSMAYLGEFYSAPGFCTERLFSYLATDLKAVGQSLEPEEEVMPVVRSLAEVREMVASGIVRDAKTLATFALYWEKIAAR